MRTRENALKKLEAGDYEGAVKILNELRTEDSNNLDLLIELADLYIRQGDPSKALALMELEEHRFQEQYLFYKHLAAIYTVVNSKKEALKATQIALNLNPNNPGLITSLGYVYWYFGDTEKAIAETEKALKLIKTEKEDDELLLKIKNNLAYYYAELGKNEKEAREYAELSYRHKEKFGKFKAWYIDVYGYVKMKFAKNTNEIDESLDLFTEALKEGYPLDTIMVNHLKEALEKREKLKK